MLLLSNSNAGIYILKYIKKIIYLTFLGKWNIVKSTTKPKRFGFAKKETL